MSEKTIDETDIRIIRSLQEDARKPFKEIAEHCGISTQTVKKRFNAMQRAGVIRGTTVVVDPRKLDKKHIVIIGVQTTQPYSNQVLNMIKKIPGICAATRAVGRWDVEAIAVKDNIEQIGIMKDTVGDFQQVKNVDVDIFVDKPLLCPKNFEFD
jgi:Lrp/AsnC family transcriptional regulator for asnA, asnC and gidA